MRGFVFTGQIAHTYVHTHSHTQKMYMYKHTHTNTRVYRTHTYPHTHIERQTSIANEWLGGWEPLPSSRKSPNHPKQCASLAVIHHPLRIGDSLHRFTLCTHPLPFKEAKQMAPTPGSGMAQPRLFYRCWEAVRSASLLPQKIFPLYYI